MCIFNDFRFNIKLNYLKNCLRRIANPLPLLLQTCRKQQSIENIPCRISTHKRQELGSISQEINKVFRSFLGSTCIKFKE